MPVAILRTASRNPETVPFFVGYAKDNNAHRKAGMTTIAFDGKTLAADKQRTVGGTPMPCMKLFRGINWQGPGEVLYGCSGDSWDAVAFRDWAITSPTPEKPTLKSLAVLAIDSSGRMWYGDEGLRFHEITLPFFAIGSGADYAIGAMAAGKSAVEAIEIASRFDSGTGLGVDHVEWSPV